MNTKGCPLADFVKEKTNANIEFCKIVEGPCAYWSTCLMVAGLSAETGIHCHVLAEMVESLKSDGKVQSYEKAYEIVSEMARYISQDWKEKEAKRALTDPYDEIVHFSKHYLEE